MRIKAVLRDGEILNLNPGSNERILSTAMKNVDRVISLTSLLKVMGLKFEDRLKMLEALENNKVHIWLAKDSQQDIIYMFKGKLPEEFESIGYQWQ
ncbi:MAG: hypothetical protein P1Q69_16800 [Candidatus Thorarchaeota archaeon]|nr:hypothetical protein [Candidatus Thorarchaeota archaeon]